MWRNKQWHLIWLVPAVCLVGVPAVRADNTLRKELAVVADGLAKAVKAFGHDAIAVGEFTGPPQLPTSGGPVIAQTLIEELNKKGLTVKRVAAVGVKGEYRDVKDKETGLLAAQIKGTVTDRTGKVLFTFSRGVFGDALLASLFGTTTPLPPGHDVRDRSRDLETSLDQPGVHVAGTRVSTSATSPFAVEILVAPYAGAALKARAAKVEDGLAFVSIKRGEVYGVRLINKSDYEAAATLTIDGLNMYAFSTMRDPKTGQPRHSQVIVDPHGSVVIKGWHLTDEVSQEFLVTEYARSAAFELGSTAKVGTITVSFAACWPDGARPPADEPADPRSHSRSADATGRGSQFKEKYVEVKRNFGVIRDVISVRYTKDSAN
jgi:hypothetical protein